MEHASTEGEKYCEVIYAFPRYSRYALSRWERDTKRTAPHFRLFMLPGVLHCDGGPGPDDVDWFGAIADWVERGLGPERLIAAKVDETGKTTRTRPVCPYPQRAAYTGRGGTDDAGNFVCRTP